jgi:hypothetical protein
MKQDTDKIGIGVSGKVTADVSHVAKFVDGTSTPDDSLSLALLK